MLYNVLLVSAMRRSESIICIHIFLPLEPPPPHYQYLNVSSPVKIQSLGMQTESPMQGKDISKWKNWTAACQAPLSFTISQSLLKFMSIESVRLSNHHILFCLLFLLPSIFPSIRVFPSESTLCIRLTILELWLHHVHSEVKSLSCVRLFATPWTVACEASPSMGFSRQEYWSGLPFPSPGDIPDQGIDTGSPAL